MDDKDKCRNAKNNVKNVKCFLPDYPKKCN